MELTTITLTNHARERLEERYHVTLPKDNTKALLQLFGNALPERILPVEEDGFLYAVLYGNNIIPIVMRDGFIVTVLSPNAWFSECLYTLLPHSWSKKAWQQLSKKERSDYQKIERIKQSSHKGTGFDRSHTRGQDME